MFSECSRRQRYPKWSGCGMQFAAEQMQEGQKMNDVRTCSHFGLSTKYSMTLGHFRTGQDAAECRAESPDMERNRHEMEKEEIMLL
jgi:hypothetical protein